MIDDRLPILLLILDGLGDRACPSLGGRTPCEAAYKPGLDRLATLGVNGVHVPFGPGRATSSEHAHWSLFGYEEHAFPGRAALEAFGVGHRPPAQVPMFHLALRAGEIRDGRVFLGARARPDEDREAADTLLQLLAGRSKQGVRFEILPLRTGEGVLLAHGAGTHEVSDTDALFDHVHPWMRPVALAEARDAERARWFASVLEEWLHDSRAILRSHAANGPRARAGLPPLDTAVTKWASLIDPSLPDFEAQTGLRGAAVTDTALYRGFARLLNMKLVDRRYDPEDPGADIRARLAAAEQLLGEADFVHVHVKATDEAGHTKNPAFKQAVIEALDRGLASLPDLAQRCVVAVTGDHASPSVGGLLHSGDPTPLVIAAPGLRADHIVSCGERSALQGELGRVRAADILPLLAGYANRPFFRGHRPGARSSCALPAAPEPMPIRH